MATKEQAKDILITTFQTVHINAILSHFSEAIEKYRQNDWEGSLSRVGKFIEATIKCLYVYCGQKLPPPRQFSVGEISNKLKNLSNFDDTVRLLIPRACIFIYDIVSNRGARHDSDGINPNQMDANVAIPTMSWILAELIRFADGKTDLMTAKLLVESLLTKKYPYFEEIDGRTYVNLKGLSAKDTGLLILSAIHPNRINREDLIDLIQKHNFSKNNAQVGVQRLKGYIDDDNDNWRLREIGLQEADKILNKN